MGPLHLTMILYPPLAGHPPGGPSSQEPRIICLLHSTLPALQVEVNGTACQGVREDEKWVSAWNLHAPGETIRITVRTGSRARAFWQGSWMEGQDGIVIGTWGTAPVTVALHGANMSLRALSSDEAASLLAPKPSHASREGSVLVEAPKDQEEAPDLDGEEEGRDSEPIPLPKTMQEETPGGGSMSLGLAAALAPPAMQEERACEERQILTLSLASHTPEQAIEALNNVLVTMPPRALIVDLRQTPSRRKQQQHHDALSKSRFRAVFGARYWDRGWAISVIQQMTPAREGHSLRRWQTIVSNPDYPEGLPLLIESVRQGYALLLIDSAVSDEHSPRQAVRRALMTALFPQA